MMDGRVEGEGQCPKGSGRTSSSGRQEMWVADMEMR